MDWPQIIALWVIALVVHIIFYIKNERQRREEMATPYNEIGGYIGVLPYNEWKLNQSFDRAQDIRYYGDYIGQVASKAGYEAFVMPGKRDSEWKVTFMERFNSEGVALGGFKPSDKRYSFKLTGTDLIHFLNDKLFPIEWQDLKWSVSHRSMDYPRGKEVLTVMLDGKHTFEIYNDYLKKNTKPVLKFFTKNGFVKLYLLEASVSSDAVTVVGELEDEEATVEMTIS